MGFRNLHHFNVALLGKQIWRLITVPDSLFAQVFRARYFPSGNIFDATCNMRASFAWKGLFRAFQALKPGFMWRPGINSAVRILQDCWGGNLPVQIYGNYEDEAEMPLHCRQFMFPNCPAWDVRKLSAYFSSDDVLSISQLPIQDTHRVSIIWYRHDSGIYSVRSGYTFLQRPPAPINRPSGFWKTLAKLPILPKIHTFGWRTSHNALPTGDRLRKANLGDGFCPFCLSVIETPLHALRDCPDASDALHLAGFPLCNFGFSSNIVLEWLQNAAVTLSHDSFILLLTILWNLWNRRNDFVHNARLQPVWLIVMNSESILADYKFHNTLSSTSPPTTNRHCWHPPPGDFIKINTDGAFNPSTYEARIGVIARNSTGEVLGGFAQHSGVSTDALHTEFLAVVAGLQLAREKGWRFVHIETDSATVVNKFNRTGPDLSVLGTHVANARVILDDFIVCCFYFVPKRCNSIAHVLATHACRSGLSIFFDSVCPDFISSVVLADWPSS
ncbi:hypothetical protein GQ457_03G017210 [Hibiscus cannabinus]